MIVRYQRMQNSPAGRNIVSIVAMLMAMVGYVVNDAFAKLASERLPIGEIIFVRGLIATVLIALVLAATGQLRHAGNLRSGAVLLRIVGEVVATFLYLTALFQMPIANAIVILQAAPLMVTAASAVILNEIVGWRRWSAIAVGFFGVVLIVRPGFSGFDIWSLAALGAAVFIVIRDLATRLVPANVPSVLMTTVTSVAVTLVGASMAPFETWLVPTGGELVLLAAAAVFILIGYFFIILTMRVGEISVASPFRYSIVVYAIFLGYAIWGDIPDLPMVAGTLIIVATGVYTFHRERLAKS